MRKIYIALILSGVMVLTLAGCTTEEELSNNNDRPTEDNAVKFDYSTQNPSDESEEQTYKKLCGTKIEFNKKTDPKDFFQEKENYSEIPFEVDQEDVSWEGTNGSTLYAESGRIYYTTKDFSQIYDGLLWGRNGEIRSDFDELCKGAELEGFSKEQAIQTVQKLTDKYGINVKNTQAFPLRSDVLIKLSKEFMSDQEYKEYLKDDTNEPMKREFSKKDEAYLVLMNSGVDEYSLYSKSYDYGENSFDGSLIWAVIKRDQLAAFEANGIFEIEKNQTNINKILTQEEAEDALKEKYQNMILKDDLICRKTELTYITVNGKNKKTYEFIPAYVFDIEYSLADEKSDKQGGFHRISQTILLDAENGKWIE